jgi:hypothetical protein
VSRELLERCGLDRARFDDVARLANGFLSEPVHGVGGCTKGGEGHAVSSSGTGPDAQQAQMARAVLAHCRVRYLRECGWEARLVAYVPASVSAQNTLLLARRV